MLLNLSATEIKRIIEHWVNTPANGYVGVNYGQNLWERLLRPLEDDDADIILQWIKEDIPLFKNLNSDQLSIVMQTVDIDKKYYFIKVGNVAVQLPTVEQINAKLGDSFDANAY